MEIFLQAFEIPESEEFVIVTTNRQEILDDKTYGTVNKLTKIDYIRSCAFSQNSLINFEEKCLYYIFVNDCLKIY